MFAWPLASPLLHQTEALYSLTRRSAGRQRGLAALRRIPARPRTTLSFLYSFLIFASVFEVLCWSRAWALLDASWLCYGTHASACARSFLRPVTSDLSILQVLACSTLHKSAGSSVEAEPAKHALRVICQPWALWRMTSSLRRIWCRFPRWPCDGQATECEDPLSLP